jgi:hypothetical protein
LLDDDDDERIRIWTCTSVSPLIPSPPFLGTENLQRNFQEKITHGWSNEAAAWEADRATSRCPILRWGAQSRDWLQLHGQQLTLLV